MRGVAAVDLLLPFAVLALALLTSSAYPELVVATNNFGQCEPIRIELCRGIGYNETSMPNLVGHELQSEVDYTLQTFAPLIEYDCSSQLKLFLCAAYVPMCTPKAPVQAIGPCRTLCDSVRQRCHPVLQGFGFPWPPALDCSRFPKQNNHETMCMEGPGETDKGGGKSDNNSNNNISKYHNNGNGGDGGDSRPDMEIYGISDGNDCLGLAKSHLYVRLQRAGRCAPLCDADILFTARAKHLSELWLSTWAYAALGLAALATMCLVLCDERNACAKWSQLLTPLLWCHNMVTVGWTVRFVVGRTGTACGTDPQLPHEPLLNVDGLSNAACASVFLLRYYFGMAACAWWAVLCLGWHRETRRLSPDGSNTAGGVGVGSTCTAPGKRAKSHTNYGPVHLQLQLTRNNFVCFIAWALPAFQTAAVIVARLVDADELIGACYVGNQSDKALQLLVATPVFCYWIFGSMNLISGYLVHCRNKDLIRNSARNTSALVGGNAGNGNGNDNGPIGIGAFLFAYGGACALLLLAVIYEFANIDVWLSAGEVSTPLWPYLTRAFTELMLGICCFAWVLGPSISTLYKRQVAQRPLKSIPDARSTPSHGPSSGQDAPSTVVSYQTLLRAPHTSSHHPHKTRTIGGMSLHQMSNYSLSRSSQHGHQSPSHHYHPPPPPSSSSSHHQQPYSSSQHHHHHHNNQHHHHHHQHKQQHQHSTTKRLYYAPPSGSYNSQIPQLLHLQRHGNGNGNGNETLL